VTLFQRIRKPFQRGSQNQDRIAENDDEESLSNDSRQFRIEATRRPNTKRHHIRQKINNMHWFRRIVTLNGCISTLSIGNSNLSDGVTPNHSIAMYLHWMFRVNFFFLFVVMCVAFFALVLFFSGFITLAGRLDNECVRVGSDTFATEGAPFAVAFALSWTTISTVRFVCLCAFLSLYWYSANSIIVRTFQISKVGYGTAYPALGYQNTSPTNCFFINFICSLEALIGVLYSGFCGAILFGKVLRIQSYAQVTFSDPLLIRFGPGVSNSYASHSNASGSDEDNTTPVPFPILEFRVVNRLYNEAGGEIMDALLNVVANKNAVNDSDSHVEGWNDDSRSRPTSDASSATHNLGGSSHHYSTKSSSDFSGRTPTLYRNRHNDTKLQSDGQAMDDDLSSILVNKHIFSKMEIEASEHPFFRRVWVARHVLDADSPILKHKVRRQIRKNGNRWPQKMNNARDIRDSLYFNQVLVSLTGVSNISACDVYAQKI
jgi:hypothetical protein